jgi:hypothetical protein
VKERIAKVNHFYNPDLSRAHVSHMSITPHDPHLVVRCEAIGLPLRPTLTLGRIAFYIKEIDRKSISLKEGSKHCKHFLSHEEVRSEFWKWTDR